MKVFTLQQDKKLSKPDLDEVVGILKKGGAIVVPTDTSYGLAALVNNKKGLEKTFRLKGRPKYKASPIAVRSRRQAKLYGNIAGRHIKLWREFLPGPLTLVTDAKGRPNPFIHRSDKSIAIRHIATKVIKQLLSILPVPITITSANISGKKDIYSLSDYQKMYKNRKQADAFIDAGHLSPKRLSTSVKLVGNIDIELRRKGVISLNAIKKVLLK